MFPKKEILPCIVNHGYIKGILQYFTQKWKIFINNSILMIWLPFYESIHISDSTFCLCQYLQQYLCNYFTRWLIFMTSWELIYTSRCMILNFSSDTDSRFVVVISADTDSEDYILTVNIEHQSGDFSKYVLYTKHKFITFSSNCFNGWIYWPWSSAVFELSGEIEW